MEVLDDELPEIGWTTVKKKGWRSDEELQQEFWNEIGFPTPASRTWEMRSASPASARDTVVDSPALEHLKIVLFAVVSPHGWLSLYIERNLYIKFTYIGIQYRF